MRQYGADPVCHCQTLRRHLKLELGDKMVNRLDPYLDQIMVALTVARQYRRERNSKAKLGRELDGLLGDLLGPL